MAAGIAISAAEPSGLWGLLKESFASGTELAKAKMDPGTDALIKAVVTDFGNAGRAKRRARRPEETSSRAANLPRSRTSASRRCGRPQQ